VTDSVGGRESESARKTLAPRRKKKWHGDAPAMGQRHRVGGEALEIERSGAEISTEQQK